MVVVLLWSGSSHYHRTTMTALLTLSGFKAFAERRAHYRSAIRCRFVDRFVRLKVLSHVARQRFSPRGASPNEFGSPTS
jgi:hypothetical protein